MDLDGLESRYYFDLKANEIEGKAVFTKVEKGAIEEMGFFESLPTAFQDIAVLNFEGNELEIPFLHNKDFAQKLNDLNLTPDNFKEVAAENQAAINGARAVVSSNLANAASADPVHAESVSAPQINSGIAKQKLQTKTDVGNDKVVSNNGKGMSNPKVREAVSEGKRQHKALENAVKAKGNGWKSNPTYKDPKTGKALYTDVETPSGNLLEYKPKTVSGIRKGANQSKKYVEATGKKTRVIYYTPNSTKKD